MTSSSAASSSTTTIDEFLLVCSERLTAQASEPAASAGAASFAHALRASTTLPFTPTWLPALDTIGQVDRTPLGTRFVEVAPLLAWEPTFRTTDHGTDIALAPLNGVRQLAGVTVGVMYIRPGCTYPLHAHPPHELYLTIAGQGEWRFGGNDDIRPVAPSSTLYNHPGDLHSALAGDTPLVALYVLWG